MVTIDFGRAVLGLVVLIGAAAPASAAQTLMPTPYPSGATGAAPLNPEPGGGGGAGQEIMKDPYPQVTGATSQGNPSTMHRHGHQHLVPSIDQRKYGVDRPPR